MLAESEIVTDESDFWRDQHDGFLTVQRFLNGGLDADEARAEMPTSCGLHRRAVDCVTSLGSGRAGPGDIAVLFGALLRRETSRPTTGARTHARLTLRQELGHRLIDVGRRAGLDAVPVGASTVITAAPWKPNWLGVPPLEATDAMEPRRLRPTESSADLFFRESLGYSAYSTPGQELGVRCVELSPGGSTILVSLPTGSGKSAIGLFGGLRPDANGTTVVVVPTISLARDQESHLREALDDGSAEERLLPATTIDLEPADLLVGTSNDSRTRAVDSVLGFRCRCRTL